MTEPVGKYVGGSRNVDLSQERRPTSHGRRSSMPDLSSTGQAPTTSSGGGIRPVAAAAFGTCLGRESGPIEL